MVICNKRVAVVDIEYIQHEFPLYATAIITVTLSTVCIHNENNIQQNSDENLHKSSSFAWAVNELLLKAEKKTSLMVHHQFVYTFIIRSATEI